MDIDKSFPSKWLAAGDLEEEGNIVTMMGVKLEKVGQDGDKKPVVYFEEFDKGLVLNKTNKELIKTVTGSAETDEWRGKRITIYPTEVPFGDKVVEAIRVRGRAPKAAAAATTKPDKEQARRQAEYRGKGLQEGDEDPDTGDDVPF